MSKCAKCFNLFHPDYISYQEIRGDIVKVCAFCKVDKNELTITDESGKVVQIVTKEEASRNYKKYLHELIKKPNIAKIVQKESSK